jgi:hypothetical protein
MTDPVARRTGDYRDVLDDVRLSKKNSAMQALDALRLARLAGTDDVIVDEHGERMNNLEALEAELGRYTDRL